ncbi:GTP-binding protein YchF [Spinellus fusiger]|nr:GTP-binding protein YchF [Spinellus fusiger]
MQSFYRPSSRLFSTTTPWLAKKTKKTVKQEAAILLGRPSNNLKMGVVGLPNIGKSSLFNCLTNSSVPAENYPFCTIDPSEAKVEVPDHRMDWLTSAYKPSRVTPAHLTVLDIAGLVKGAAQGAGLGNMFLANVGHVDAIYHLVRAFDNDNVAHVENSVDPLRDMSIIQEELRLKDEESLERQLAELVKLAKFPDTKRALLLTRKEELAVVEKVANYMAQGHDVRQGAWDGVDVQVINTLHLLTAKPMVYVCNMSEEDYLHGNNRWLPEIEAWVRSNHAQDRVVPLSVPFETKLAAMNKEEATDYLASVSTRSQLPTLILAGYRALHLIHYFTCGQQEVRAWTVRDTAKAPQAAGVIHTDFERGFISADVIKYTDLYTLKSEAAVRSAGRFLQKGKDYTMEDGDIVHFKFNVTGTKKK